MMDEQVRKTGAIILIGGTILYPTDTIWGLGCDATNREAVKKLYQIKERPNKKSMLVLMNGPSMLSKYLDDIPESAMDIIIAAKRPTTIIYQNAKNFAPDLLGEDGSIGIRITSDPFCRKLIEITGKPIVSTSANISDSKSPSSFGDIENSIREKVDYVVEWRQNEITTATPSAILKLNSQGGVTVLRP